MGSAASESSGDLEALMAGNDPEIRLEAAHCLAITTENVDRAMAVATQCLMDQSFLRIPAAGVLADMARGNPSALRLLSEMLRENEVQVVIAAAGALAQMQVADQTAVGTLIDRLADPDPRVRRACVEALGALGAQASQAMQGLLTLIHDADPDVRRAVTRALGNVGAGDEEAVRALADSLGDEEVAPMAALALAKCGDAARAAVPQLIAALEDPDVRIEAIRALATLGPRASTAVPALFKILLAPGSILPSTYTVEEEVVRCLEQMGPVIRPQLLREIDRYAESSEPIPRTLCQLVEAVGPFVADAIPVLVKCLSCTDYDDRVNTVRALGAMGPVAQKVTSRLREMLGNPGEHPDVILALRKALRRISPTE
jgi:HEAT repeat protein